MILQENLGVRVQLDEATRLLRASWLPGRPVVAFQRALEWLMDVSRQQGIENWLINIDQLPPLGPAEQAWIAQDWFAAMATTPVRHLALVLPPGLHNYLVATAPVHDPRLAPPFDLHFFPDDATAFEWLLHEVPHRHDLQQEWEAAEELRPAPTGWPPARR